MAMLTGIAMGFGALVNAHLEQRPLYATRPFFSVSNWQFLLTLVVQTLFLIAMLAMLVISVISIVRQRRGLPKALAIDALL